MYKQKLEYASLKIVRWFDKFPNQGLQISLQISKGGLISEVIFNLVPSSKKCAKSLSLTIQPLKYNWSKKFEDSNNFTQFLRIKVSKCRKQSMVSWILPKNERWISTSKITTSSMLIFGQKACFLGPTIFEIPRPNWY